MRLLRSVLLLIILTGSSSMSVIWDQTQSYASSGRASSEAITNQPPVVAVSVAPSQASTGDAVYATFLTTDVGGIMSYVSIDWGDGSRPDFVVNVTSGNMCAPLSCALPVGVSILVRGQDPNTIVNGSIIAFKPYISQPEYLVVSRVTQIIPASQSNEHQITFWTKGDANAVMDAWDQTNDGIPGSEVVGVYQSIINVSGVYHSYASTGNSQSHYFVIHVNATDTAGFTGYVKSSVFIMDRPPTLNISGISPSPASAGQTVTLTFLASDPDGTIANVSINWGDGTTPETLQGSATLATHTYGRFVGEMQVIVIASDNSGSTATQTKLLYVQSPPAPASPFTILGLPRMVFYGIIAAWISAAVISGILAVAYRRKIG